MNTLQNLRLNDLKYQIKVKQMELSDVISQNKCICSDPNDEDLFERLASNSVNVQELISQYYCKRSTKLIDNKTEEQSRVKISPNRLSMIYKIAENVNFLRSLYIKNNDAYDKDLDIIDGLIAIFFNELTVINDKSTKYNDKQLLRSFCVERVLSRMEVRPFYELATGNF